VFADVSYEEPPLRGKEQKVDSAAASLHLHSNTGFCRRPRKPHCWTGSGDTGRLTVYTPSVYTNRVADEIDGFEWDGANVGHILRHRVTPFEVEEAVGRPHVAITAQTVGGEERWKLFGKTASGRYLVVVFTIRRRLLRAVTAYEMNATERKKYGPQIG
jgi:uncharacterized protein